jgi:hypothetical protein
MKAERQHTPSDPFLQGNRSQQPDSVSAAQRLFAVRSVSTREALVRATGPPSATAWRGAAPRTHG